MDGISYHSRITRQVTRWHETGVIGLPLRLLAREVYTKVARRAGEDKVALVTDGRMSGASGKVLNAIHVTPEAAEGGPIAKIRDGDLIRLDATTGRLDVLVDETRFARRRRAK